MVDEKRVKRSTVSSMVQYKTHTILPVLLVCMVLAAAFVCQIHTAPSPHAHAAPFSHHHGSSPQVPGTGLCLVAVLPAGILLTIFLSVWIAADVAILPSAAFVYLPFIPPRSAAR
jgi:hypothetical protein